MRNLLLRWLINGVALYAASELVAGITVEGGWVVLLVMAILFGLVNAIIRPLLKLLTCPLIVLTLGLFTLVINALMLWLASVLAGWLGVGFHHTVMAIGPSLRPWPRPGEPGYRSTDYADAKREESERMLNTLEAHFPGFRKGLRYHTLASPSTIERYAMKPKGCVAGPKQSMGQELLNRPHASTEWKNLFLCGESTVMGTGSPAVTISGISAANMVLRKMGMEEYQWHPGMRDFVGQISAAELAGRAERDGINPNAPQSVQVLELHDKAALCQWCENHPCRKACSYDIDIRGIVRRIEMGNLQGAYRELIKGRDGEISCLHCSAPCEEICAAKSDEIPEVPIHKLLASLRPD